MEIACPHMGAAAPDAVRRGLCGARACRRCAELPPSHRAPSSALWLCLTCGHVGCARETSGGRAHAAEHRAQNPLHHIAASLSTGELWCYGCDDAVVPPAQDATSSAAAARLRECDEAVRAAIAAPKRAAVAAHAPATTVGGGRRKGGRKGAPPTKPQRQQQQAFKGIPGFRGLTNLGNTCFFNSVLQNLVHTPPLVRALLGTRNAETGEWTQQPSSSQLASGPMTSGLLAVAVAMHKPASGGAFSPSELFSAVCKKVPRFRSFQQQDAHELFITVLDGISREQRSVAKPKPRPAPDSDEESKDGGGDDEEEEEEEEPKRRPRVETLVEEIFGGETVSAVTCHECGEVSRTVEPFLNLSLPIPGKASAADTAEEWGFFRGKKGRGLGRSFTSEELFGSRHAAPAPPPQRMSKNRRKKLRQQGIVPAPKKHEEPASEPTAEKPSKSDATTTSSDKEQQTVEESADDASETELKDTDAPPQPKAPFVPKDFRAAPPTKSEGGLSLQSCLAAYTSPEELTGVNRYRCPACTAKRAQSVAAAAAEATAEGEEEEGEEKHPPAKKGGKKKAQTTAAKDSGVLCDATKQIVVRRLPQVLVIQIKRFSQSGRGYFQKISDNVAVPMVLNMAPYVEAGSPSAQEPAFYGLYGVSEHAGSLTGGHYTATVSWGTEWCHISDSSVTRSDAQRATSSSVYMLFYERRQPPAARVPEALPGAPQEIEETRSQAPSESDSSSSSTSAATTSQS